MVWSNAQPGVTYTIQTATTLDPNWVDYIQISVTQRINTNQLVSFNPPAGMAFIPAGSFTMGDTLDGESDASPITVHGVGVLHGHESGEFQSMAVGLFLRHEQRIWL